MCSKGQYYLVDFNIARTYDPGQKNDTRLLGTAMYAAPEHYGFGQTDARSDIYSLGVTLNVLLTGTTPAEHIATGPLTLIIKKATQIDPERRYPCAQAMSDAIVSAIPNIVHSTESHQLIYKHGAAYRTAPGLLVLVLIAAWTWFLLFDTDQGDNTITQLWALRAITWIIPVVPCLYNLNVFGLLDRTLSDREYGSLRYWVQRLAWSICPALLVSVVIMILFI